MIMKIRNATKFDMPQIFRMLRSYRDAGPSMVKDIDDEATPTKIMNHILVGGGIAIVYDAGVTGGGLHGMLLAVKTPSLWDASKFTMQEIVLWVDVLHRGTTGHRMITEYVYQCNELKDQGHIESFTISQMHGSNLKYDRFGFKPVETTWSQ